MACIQSVALCYMAGATVDIDWQYTEDDGATPVDLTGATATLSLLDAADDLTAIEDFTGGITDATNGSGTFSLTKVESQALIPLGTDGVLKISFVGTIKIVFADTTVAYIAGLNVTFEQNASRP